MPEIKTSTAYIMPIIQPSRKFEGSGPEFEFESYIDQLPWTVERRRHPAISAFFRAKLLDMEKKHAVDVLSKWLATNTQLDSRKTSLMSYATFAYKNQSFQANAN